ncbi:hypothetical protein BV154_003280 [Haemophilus influenzae]|uniref:hypothetical protein n=1 Tax=Haemophilus influenzae TaxID=727 RepID=UPI000D00EB04|nr:hypothetical protein [Haemophilus influenzae]PRI43477.1 hypothetical protein BVZ70_01452 [Haemophilus influenzae]PRI85916.1 hypothetical protein BV020_00520 [Haemophilus influenzae]PRI90486.1 hypothetical protein BV021_00709 [Haemophilus influenzae]PRJ85177.1 hypothetical protein BV154_01543 [Haemophilus influenzae]PRJ95419.1 hypothetical protein BV166_00119 [Haemophilus influenzae]
MDLNILSNVADILSIIGFIVSIYTLCLTRKIKQELWSRASIKRRKKQIENSTKNLANYLNDYNANRDKIKELIDRVGAGLVHLKTINNKELLKHIKALKKLVNKYKYGPDEKTARDIKTQLSIVRDELNEQEETYKLGGC